MNEFLGPLLLASLPLFVAIDPIAAVPFVVSLTENSTARERSRTVALAMFTALILGLSFLAVGKGVFLALGIKVADFLIAGGLLLLLLSAKELLTGKMVEAGDDPAGVGAVPIGTPLIVGPAVLTTLLILVDLYPAYIVIISFILNLLLTWLVLARAGRILGFLGKPGIRAVSKVAGILLAAIAVKMIRQGLLEIIG